ncbi:hypothetical protein [Micromonospora sp. NPDC002575]|uniref:hypothetical protein n=1 Tax=Micromonospora sp. NPDC002575 TaxID=3364222 RepID=UPI0036B06D30
MSHNAVYVWRRRWRADGEVGLASKGRQGRRACSPTSSWVSLPPRWSRGRPRTVGFNACLEAFRSRAFKRSERRSRPSGCSRCRAGSRSGN